VTESSYVSRDISQKLPPDICSAGTDAVLATMCLADKVLKTRTLTITHASLSELLPIDDTVSGCGEVAKSSFYNICDTSHAIKHNSIIFFVTPRAIHKHVWNNRATEWTSSLLSCHVPIP
jgi:hypothetical protein